MSEYGLEYSPDERSKWHNGNVTLLENRSTVYNKRYNSPNNKSNELNVRSRVRRLFFYSDSVIRRLPG